jgi:hypothetical protein
MDGTICNLGSNSAWMGQLGYTVVVEGFFFYGIQEDY